MLLWWQFQLILFKAPKRIVGVVTRIGRTGNPAAAPVLLPLLDSADNGVRRAAAEALGQLGDAGAGPRLAKLAEDERTDDVKRAAAAAAHRVGWRPEALRDRVRLAVFRDDPAAAAAEGPAAVPALMEFIGHAIFSAPAEAGLVLIGAAAGPTVAEVLGAPGKWEDKVRLLVVLDRVGAPGAAVEPLIRLLTDNDWKCREGAGQHLAARDLEWRQRPAARALVAKALTEYEDNWQGAGAMLQLVADSQSVAKIAAVFRKGVTWGPILELLEKFGWRPESPSDHALVAIAQMNWARAIDMAVAGEPLSAGVLHRLRQGRCDQIFFRSPGVSWADPQSAKPLVWLLNNNPDNDETIRRLDDLLRRHHASLPAADLLAAVSPLLNSAQKIPAGSGIRDVDWPTSALHALVSAVSLLDQIVSHYGAALGDEQLAAIARAPNGGRICTEMPGMGAGDPTETVCVYVDCAPMKRAAMGELLRRAVTFREVEDWPRWKGVVNLLEKLGWTPEHAEERASVALLCKGDVATAIKEGGPALPALNAAFADQTCGLSPAAVVDGLKRLQDIRSLDVLAVAVSHPEEQVRAAAVEALAALRDGRATDLVWTAVTDPAKRVREAATDALIKLKDVRLVKPLVERLGRTDSRYGAALALGRIGNAEATDGLLAALQDRKGERLEVLHALAKAGDARALPALLAVLEDRRDEGRSLAAEGLGRIGDAKAVPALLAALPELAPPDRRSCVEALGLLTDARAVEALLPMLSAPGEHCQQLAAIALGRIGDARAAAALIVALGDADQYVTWAAATALGQIGDARAVEPLLAVLADPAHRARAEAATALGRIGGARAAEGLKPFLHERAAAVEAFCTIVGKDAVPPLLAALKQKPCPARTALLRALGQFGTAGGVDALAAALTDIVDWQAQAAAAQALGDVGGPRAVELLLVALQQSNPLDEVINALGRIGDPRAVAPLAAVFKAGGQSGRRAAATALGLLRDARAVDALATGLRDRDWAVQVGAITALGRIGGPRAVDALLGMLPEKIGPVRQAVIEALGNTGDDRAIIPVAAALNDHRAYVRLEAVTALGKFSSPHARTALQAAAEDREAHVWEAAARFLTPGTVPA